MRCWAPSSRLVSRHVGVFSRICGDLAVPFTAARAPSLRGSWHSFLASFWPPSSVLPSGFPSSALRPCPWSGWSCGSRGGHPASTALRGLSPSLGRARAFLSKKEVGGGSLGLGAVLPEEGHLYQSFQAFLSRVSQVLRRVIEACLTLSRGSIGLSAGRLVRGRLLGLVLDCPSPMELSADHLVELGGGPRFWWDGPLKKAWRLLGFGLCFQLAFWGNPIGGSCSLHGGGGPFWCSFWAWAWPSPSPCLEESAPLPHLCG